MTIEFLKKDEGWVAEFEATADFNLHIEGIVEGNVNIYQRTTASGGYTLVRGATPYPSYGNVYDYDFTSLVYPKFIKVVCPVQPSYAEVMSTGEVTELKYQEKKVEITENGTTIVAPDAGFAALNAVSVKVNVPNSGGGSAEEKFGMMYITKESFFAALELPADTDIPQDEFSSAWSNISQMFPVVAVKGTPKVPNHVQGTQNLLDEIMESRFTCAGWKALALDFDRSYYHSGGFEPIWKASGSTIAEAKAVFAQAFPNQMTEAEFFA